MRTRQDDVELGFTSEARRARLNAAMSQADLADYMVAHGHGWHQTTVAKTEDGSRRVLLSEAVSLASILRVDLPGYQ